MDVYDFDLYEKNQQAPRKAPKNPPGEVKPISDCKRKYSKNGGVTKVAKHKKKIAKMVAEYNRKRPTSYLDAAEKAGLKWEDIIHVDEGGESPPKRILHKKGEIKKEIEIETEE